MNEPLMLAKHIGYDITASGRAKTEDKVSRLSLNPWLDLFSTSGFEDDGGGYCPPAHIRITSLESIIALRNFCNELINEKQP